MSRAIAFLIGGSIFFLFLAVFAFRQPPVSPLSGGSSSLFSPPLTRGGREGFPCRDFSESSITINNHKISVALADTPAEQARGLSGCEGLPENSGMLFPYSRAQEATFWMKDMLIPIDIIWIRDGEVVGIEQNVQPPSPRQSLSDGGPIPDSQLPLYKSPGPITAVLELPAGKSSALDIKAGDRVE